MYSGVKNKQLNLNDSGALHLHDVLAIFSQSNFCFAVSFLNR